MKKILWLLLCSIAIPSLAQVKLEKIDKYLASMQKEWNVPGMSVGIVKDGRLIFAKGYGEKEVGKNNEPDGNTLYAVASNSKAFTSSAIALLVQEGKLKWDDKVKDYLPYFQLYDEYVTENTTLRDMLSHRVGLGTFSGDIIWYRSNLNPEEILNKIQYLEPAFDFRAGYGYSNVMYTAAGEIIKVVSGKSWEDFIRDRFLTRLNMNRTITSIRNLSETNNYATPHALVDGVNVPIEWTNWDAVAPMGGLISSVNDMAQWVIFNLDNGIWLGDTILSEHSRNLLWTLHNNYVVDHTDLDFATHFRGYGLGWVLSDYHGNLRVGHSGGYDGMITYIQMIPDLDLGVIVLTNGLKSPVAPAANYIIDTYLGLPEKDYSSELLDKWEQNNQKDTRIEDRIQARVMNTSPSLPLENYTGVYHADIYGNIEISQSGDGLEIKFEHSPDLNATLTHWHYDVWKINWKKPLAWFSFGTIQFQLDHQLNVTGFTFDVPNDDIWFYELKPTKIN